jgi:uncharacterized protein (DUF697 family)
MAEENDIKEETAAAEAAETTIEDIDQEKLDSAHAVVKKYMYWSMGAGLIPIPLVDIATVSGVQLKMLSELSKVYDVKFSENAGKSIISALVGGISADALSRSYLTSLVKSIPLVGIVGAVSMPIFSGAATWAIGKVFIQHFASGGTFLDFDPVKVKSYFKDLYQQGQTIAQNMKTAKA